MKYLAFHLEIAKVIPFNQDLNAHRPLGITCAAAWDGQWINRINT